MLCREVPRAADPPDPIELGLALRHPTSIAVFQHRLHWPAEMPPLTPDRFEAVVLKALAAAHARRRASTGSATAADRWAARARR